MANPSAIVINIPVGYTLATLRALVPGLHLSPGRPGKATLRKHPSWLQFHLSHPALLY